VPEQLLGALRAFQIRCRLGLKIAELKSARSCGFLILAGLAKRYGCGCPVIFGRRCNTSLLPTPQCPAVPGWPYG